MTEEKKENAGRRPLMICMADVEPLALNAPERPIIESAYRRGFFQGYWRAMEDLFDVIGSKRYRRLSLEKQEEFLDRTIRQWQIKIHKGEREHPPKMFDAAGNPITDEEDKG